MKIVNINADKEIKKDSTAMAIVKRVMRLACRFWSSARPSWIRPSLNNLSIPACEVNPVDFLTISAFQVFIPELYYDIRNNIDLFIIQLI